MTFAVPLFLTAVLAAGIPVVLHMINRQKAKDLPFSTLRFLRISVEKTRAKRRIHDVFLLLVRMALLILIALGLAKPTLTNLRSLFGGGAASAVVIILDNSASMGMVDQGRMRFETAVNAAMQIMDELKDGDQIALLLTGGPAFPEQGKLDRTHEKVRQMLAGCQVSYERADLGVKVEQARKLLAESEAVNKQIYVLTDLQKLCWDSAKVSPLPLGEGVRGAGSELARQSPHPNPLPKGEGTSDPDADEQNDIPIIFVDCNRTPKPNVAVQGLKLAAPVPVAGLPVKATVELFNAAPVAQQRHLELYVDGSKEQSSPVLKIPPEGRLTHDFQFAFKTGGLHRGEVRLVGDDGSKLDERRFLTIEVDQGIPVAIVQARRHEIPYLDDTFYLEQALSPGRSGGWALRTTTLTAGELLGEQLSRYTVIFCVNLPAPDADTAARLRAYVENGGNLIWISGDNVDPTAYNQMNEQAGSALLPAPLLEVRAPGVGTDRDSWNISFLDKKHPALGHLVEPASLYQSVLVYKHVRMDTKRENSDVWTLARLDDGEALLAQRNVGKGKVLMLATSAHVGWTNMPLRPIFLPLLARLTFELAGAEQTRHMALAGSPLVVRFDEQSRPGGVEVVPPSGETIRRATVDEKGNRAAEFRHDETHDIGIYIVRLLESTRPRRIAYSVNVDPDEAEEAKIERAELEKRFGETPIVFAENPDDLSSTFAWLREGKSLWGIFLWCVLAALVFETFLSNQLSPKQEDQLPEDVPPGMRRLARKGQGAE